MAKKTTFPGLFLNYELHGANLPDGRYVLCFSSSYVPPSSAAPIVITGKPGKPLVVYGLTWKRLDVPVGSPLLTVAGEQVLLQNATITANATAVRIEGTQHGIFQSTLKGWELEGQPPAVTAVVTGANHRIWQSTIADGGTAIRAEGMETVITDNYLSGSQFGVYLASAARKVSVIKNAYTGVFANCPLVGSTATYVRCLVYLEPGANENQQPVSFAPEDRTLFRITKQTVQGYEYLASLYHFRSEPGTMELLEYSIEAAQAILKSADSAALNNDPEVRTALIDELLGGNKNIALSAIVPNPTEAPYVASHTGLKVPYDGFVAVIYDHPQRATQGISDRIALTEIPPVLTTPGGIALIASGGDAGGGESATVVSGAGGTEAETPAGAGGTTVDGTAVIAGGGVVASPAGSGAGGSCGGQIVPNAPAPPIAMIFFTLLPLLAPLPLFALRRRPGR